MKVAVVAANGRVGRLVVKEARARGLDVTAIVRGENKSGAPDALVKDVLALEKSDLERFDAVVDAVGTWTPETLPAIPGAAKHLCEILAGTKTRLLVVGGAGSLFTNPQHTATVADDPAFPESYKPVASAHAEALAALRASEGVDWTYISPACDFRADEPRTGEYTLGGEELTLSPAGDSMIGYADYALAVVDELVSATPHIRARISVVRK
jgi:putative NADH-flavin reductase